MNHVKSHTNPSDPSVGTRRRSTHRCCAAVTAALIAAGLSLAGTTTAEARMTGEATVVCNAAYNTIEVTPRVLSDWERSDQWTATRVWIATWNGSSWTWSAQPWKVEVASTANSPIAADIEALSTQTFSRSNGYYYIYVDSYMWDGRTWYGQTGMYTRSYTQETPSVSHEQPTRTSATYCTL